MSGSLCGSGSGNYLSLIHIYTNNNNNSNNNTNNNNQGNDTQKEDNSSKDESTGSNVPYNPTGAAVVNYACQFVGNPYVYGGNSLTNGTDCSGFIKLVYEHFGVSLPRSSGAMQSVGRAVSYSQAMPGDIICYSGHVALYMGGGQIVHASNSKPYPQGGIKILSLIHIFLNPIVRLKTQFIDSIPKEARKKQKPEEILKRVAEYLKELNLSPDVLESYPFQLSGGMRQRAIIALATFMAPGVVLADEPTTALDVVVQKGILMMLMRLQKQLKNTLIIVSHDRCV